MIGENHIIDFNNENLDFDMTKMLDNILNIEEEASKYGDMSFLQNNDLDYLNSTKFSDAARLSGFDLELQPKVHRKINGYQCSSLNPSPIENFQKNAGYQKNKTSSKYLEKVNFHANNPAKGQVNVSKLGKSKISNQSQMMSQQVEENYPDHITENFFNTFEGKFVHLIKNYNGSKLLQASLPKTEKTIISKIFLEVSRYLPDLIQDPYGNYFIQKLYPLLNVEEKLNFLFDIQNDILPISYNNIGNYSLQCLIENFNTDYEIESFCSALKDNETLMKMIMDNSSIHVLEKILMFVPENKILFIFQFVIDNFMLLSTNQNGLCIVKKIIMTGKSYFTQMKIQNLIMMNFNYLVLHTFGNHTIQAVLEVKFNTKIDFIYFFRIGHQI
jgi:hypothetical protein